MSEQRDAGGGHDRERLRSRAYQYGTRARELKEAGRMWLEPHYPPADSDLALAWLDGWADKGAELYDSSKP